MNARPSPCHALHEPISLLAAGCLPPEEQAAVRSHLDGCRACAARFAALAAMCDSLDRSRPATASAAAILRRWDALAADGLPRPPARSTRPLALPFAAAIAAALLVAAWWMADQQATPPPAESPSRIHLAIHELAHADTDAEFDEALRRHYGSAMFGASGPTSRARDLMKEFLE
jgi:anti-sigma factor RsiW